MVTHTVSHSHGIDIPGRVHSSQKGKGGAAASKGGNCSKLRKGKVRIGRPSKVSSRKAVRERKRKGNTKRRQGHVRPRMAGRKHKAIRKKLFQQAALIQAEQACAQKRTRRRKIWAALAWRLTKRITRPVLLIAGRWALRQAPQPVVAQASPWLAMAPPPVFRAIPAPSTDGWGWEEEAVGLEVGAMLSGGCLTAGFSSLVEPSGVRALRPSLKVRAPKPEPAPTGFLMSA